MLNSGILNAQLLRVLGETGHADWLMLTDAGMPIPKEKERVDLAITKQMPRIYDVLKLVVESLAIEKVYLAEEVKDVSPKYLKKISGILEKSKCEIVYVPHEDLIDMSQKNKTRACIRSGEYTSYSTMIIQAGVPYGGDDDTSYK